jgi:hypothetical protein
MTFLRIVIPLYLLFEHDLRANASRLSRGKTGIYFSGSCSVRLASAFDLPAAGYAVPGDRTRCQDHGNRSIRRTFRTRRNARLHACADRRSWRYIFRAGSSFLSLQFALSPMRVFARLIEHPFDIPIESPQHTACVKGSAIFSAMISAPTAVCHASRFCSAFGSFMM